MNACLQGGPCGSVPYLNSWAKKDKKLNPQDYDGIDNVTGTAITSSTGSTRGSTHVNVGIINNPKTWLVGPQDSNTNTGTQSWTHTLSPWEKFLHAGADAFDQIVNGASGPGTQVCDKDGNCREVVPKGGIVYGESPARRSVEGEAEGAAEGAAAKAVGRSLYHPESLRGATPKELDAVLGDLERSDAPHATGGGFRVRIPGGVAVIENGDNTLVNGVHKMTDVTHRGPYIKFQIGKRVQRIPLAGNPALD